MYKPLARTSAAVCVLVQLENVFTIPKVAVSRQKVTGEPRRKSCLAYQLTGVMYQSECEFMFFLVFVLFTSLYDRPKIYVKCKEG